MEVFDNKRHQISGELQVVSSEEGSLWNGSIVMYKYNKAYKGILKVVYQVYISLPLVTPLL